MQTEVCYCSAAGLGTPASCHGAVGSDGSHRTLTHYYQHLSLSHSTAAVPTTTATLSQSSETAYLFIIPHLETCTLHRA